MANIISYILNYKDKTFKEEPFNEVDNVIFSSIIYLNFLNIVSNKREYISLYEAGNIFLKNNTYKEISKLGIAQKDSYKILKNIYDSTRYKDVLMYNYVYENDINKQFGAITFKFDNKIVVSFEGTDGLLSGWKEDFELSYMFPVPAQQCAIDYLNDNIKFLDRNVIVVGHSKGGNLALISSMYTKPFIRRKIKKIYSNDGPGVRKAQIESKEYKKIKDRYIHLIPNYSYIGILLRNDEYKVIKSKRKDVMSHSVMSWQVENTSFIESELSNISKRLENSVIMWLDAHDDEKREKMISTVFKIFEDCDIYELDDFKNINKTLNVLKKLKMVDQETKDLITNFIQFNVQNILDINKK